MAKKIWLRLPVLAVMAGLGLAGMGCVTIPGGSYMVTPVSETLRSGANDILLKRSEGLSVAQFKEQFRRKFRGVSFTGNSESAANFNYAGKKYAMTLRLPL